MTHYLVTGAAGFIGARVSKLLLESGHTVLGLDNMNDAYDVRMKKHRLEELQSSSGFTFQLVDISDWSSVKKIQNLSSNVSAVINLAARAGVRASVEDPWVYVDTNITGTLNMLEYCQRNDVPKFVLASSSSVYGLDTPLPTPETASSAYPLQAYAASKKGAEAMAHAYHYLYNIDVSVVRFFTVYGPAGRPDMSIFRFIRWIVEDEQVQLFGDGTQSRGFTYIDDIARGVIQALIPVGYEIINLGGHEEITMNALIAMIAQKVGLEAIVNRQPFVKADLKANLADVSKAGDLLGWEPVVGFDEGISRTISWYYENRDWASRIDLNI